VRDPRVSCVGVGDGDHLGDAGGDWRGRRAEHCDGSHDTFDLWPLVDVLRPRLRDPVPAAADGGALQGLLQHLRQSIGVHNCLRGADQRWRASDGLARADPLPRLQRGHRHTDVPVQDAGDAVVAGDPGGRVVRYAIRLSDRTARAGLRRLQVRGEHSGGRRTGRPGSSRGRADGRPGRRPRQTVRQ